MSRLTAPGRLERLLSVVPWVVANDGPTIAEVAERFDYPEQHLIADLDVLFMVGIYPYTPDQLVEVVVEDERVWIHYAEYFERPLRLTPAQALALVTAGSSLLSVPGADADGPLSRGLAKLAATLGVAPGDELEVDLGAAAADVLTTLRSAVAERRRLRIDYYTYGRDERTEREIEPRRLLSDQGAWYVLAHCHRAEGERLFRVDRIHAVEETGERFEAPADVREISVFEPGPDDPRVTLCLDAGAAWVPENHPAESVETLPDGRLRVVLAISALPWLERLLVRLGPSVEVEDADDDIPADLQRATASRILSRYLRSDD